MEGLIQRAPRTLPVLEGAGGIGCKVIQAEVGLEYDSGRESKGQNRPDV